MAYRIKEGIIPAPAGQSALQWALAQASKGGAADNGDGFLLLRDGPCVLVALADGVGSGKAAQLAADTGLATIAAHGAAPIGDLFDRVHESVSGTRGLALALARIDLAQERMEWAAVGDIDGQCSGGDGVTSLVQKGGTLGLHHPGIHLQAVRFADQQTAVLTTDGISKRYRDAPPPGEDIRAAAAQCLETFGRSGDDRTVLVVRAVRADAAALA